MLFIMEKKKPEKGLELYALNSKDHNDKVLYDLIRDGKIETLYSFLRKGYPLSAFTLNLISDFYSEAEVDKALSECWSLYDDAYEFLIIYKGKEETHKFLVKEKFEHIIKCKFSNEELFKYKFYDFLFETDAGKEYYQMHAPIEEVLQNEKCFPLLGCFFSKRITTEEQMTMVYNYPYKEDLRKASGGLKFLFDKGDYDIVIPIILWMGVGNLGFDTIDQCLEIILHRKGVEWLYALDLHEIANFLLRYAKKHPEKETEITSLLIKNKRWNELAMHGFYDYIDWDDYFKDWPSSARGHFYSWVEQLERQGAFAKLWKMRQYRRAIRALSH